MDPAQGPHCICRSGRHCLALTGATYDGRCKACRNESHRSAQATYSRTHKGRLADNRYKSTARAQLLDIQRNAERRA